MHGISLTHECWPLDSLGAIIEDLLLLLNLALGPILESISDQNTYTDISASKLRANLVP